ncbi:carboxylesterase family protein [Sorangium sp. So ce1099]
MDNGVFAFKGIPYAAPPVGDLRWRAPRPVTSWTKTRRADAYGDSSWQNAETCIQEGGGDPRPRDEDCLYLNVWAPSFEPGSVSPSRPVLVWIHGGAYIIGAGGLPPYTGWPLASRDVVLVTFNYRLGRLGFFAHPALTRERDIPVYGFTPPTRRGDGDRRAAR